MYNIEKLTKYKFKEHKFNYKDFIGGWYIPEKICDDILKYFEDNKHLIEPGLVGTPDNKILNKKVKESLDLVIHYDNFKEPFLQYRICLSKIIKLYQKKYIELQQHYFYNVTNGYNIQYYKPKAGFKQWHSERSRPENSKRLLVFMTYLNDVKDGGTEFKYQNITSPAKKGLTLLWPVDWTHTHRGQISKTNEKYIITGWLSFENTNEEKK